MRAGDADRQAVADKLRGALEEGRLDLHEYDERLQRAYAAKTYGDLNGLLDDLPDTVPGEPLPAWRRSTPHQPAVVVDRAGRHRQVAGAHLGRLLRHGRDRGGDLGA